jgi:hypothetical protein
MLSIRGLLGALAAAAVLLLASTAEASPRHKRLGHKPCDLKAHAPTIPEMLRKAVGDYTVLGAFWEGKNELEVILRTRTGQVLEVVFKRRGGSFWYLAGYEYPVPTAALPPRAMAAVQATYPGKILEVEEVYNAWWVLLAFQVTIQQPGTIREVFVKADGTFIPDPL